MRWGAFLILASLALIFVEGLLLMVKPAKEIESILKSEYASLSIDPGLDKTIAADVRRFADSIKGFLPSKNKIALSFLLGFRWVVLQNLFPPFIIFAGVGLSEGFLKRSEAKENLGFFSSRRFQMGVGGVGLTWLVIQEYLVSPWNIPSIPFFVNLMLAQSVCIFLLLSNWPGKI
jgi:hypothetical protein